MDLDEEKEEEEEEEEEEERTPRPVLAWIGILSAVAAASHSKFCSQTNDAACIDELCNYYQLIFPLHAVILLQGR